MQKLGKSPNFGVISDIQRAKFGAPTRISEAKFGAKPPDLLIWKYSPGLFCRFICLTLRHGTDLNDLRTFDMKIYEFCEI